MRKYMSILLCICMLISAFPTLALAEGEMCENHPQHTEDCGYAPAFAGSACRHELGEHDDACYQSVTACLHQHGNDGCTYTPAKDAVMCTHVCDASVCGYVAPRPENPCACQPAEDGTFAHVENCGYVPADPGVSCNFQHGAHPACTCVPAQPESGVCNHVCSVENGCITPVLSCTHAAAHDETCGYVPASEGSPCTHSCDTCNPTIPDNGGDDDTAIPGDGDDTPTPDDPGVYPGCAHHGHDENCGGFLNNCTYVCETCVAEIQQMINALPDHVTPENRTAVEAALTAIHERYALISTDAMGKINFAKFEYLASLLTVPPDLFSFSLSKQSVPAGNGLICNFTFVNTATGQPVSAITAGGAAISSVSLVANGAGASFYLPAGTYTIVEQVEGNWLLSTTVNGVAAPGNTFTGTAGMNYSLIAENSYDDTEAPTPKPNLTYNGAEQIIATAASDTVVYVGDNVNNAVWSANAKAKNAGTYKVWYKPESADDSYDIQHIEVTIAQAPITVKAEDATKVYGGEDPIFTAENISGEVFTGDELIFSFDLDPEIATEVGEYDIIPSVSFNSRGAENYDITLEKGKFTITPAELTIKPTVTTKTYGEAEPELKFEIDGFKGSEAVGDIQGSLTRESGSDVGEYKFDIRGLNAGKNYTLKLQEGAKFTITRATPTAADFSFTAPAEKIATGDEVSAGVEVRTDVSGMGAVTIGYYNDKGEPAAPNAAGTYTVKIDVAAGKNFTAASGITADTWAFTLEADSADTDNTKKVEDITKDNVKPGDKTDLEKAKEDLEKALEDNKDKYTDEQKKEIQADIDRIDEALKAITSASTQYTITYGNHGYWYRGSYYALSFKCDGPYAKFLGITIDGHPVDKAYYTAFEGSTVVNLSPQLLKLLSVGPHAITFAYSDGSATGYFYVLQAPINAVMTGDDSDGGLMALTLSLSLMGLALSLGALKRRKTQ